MHKRLEVFAGVGVFFLKRARKKIESCQLVSEFVLFEISTFQEQGVAESVKRLFLTCPD